MPANLVPSKTPIIDSRLHLLSSYPSNESTLLPLPRTVNVKLDYSNYLNWNFQMQLLLESNGIMGYVDGSTHCPPQLSSTTCESGTTTSSQNDEFIVWKMHDRAIMQLITATLSPIAMSCAIGSTSSKDMWNQLKENFQRDYLSAAGVYFVDEDIVILALNGLPTEYNTFRCVIRGHENVISLHEFRSQLLVEEVMVEASTNSPLLTAMVATTSFPVNHSSSSNVNRGFKPYNGNKTLVEVDLISELDTFTLNRCFLLCHMNPHNLILEFLALLLISSLAVILHL
ncbi:hypothetical protein D5086_008762 [Populus alba]|uniref:Uncharacterized protein n=1 Tax=Populus alba TaxID=43335 RepID=A0ACC4CGI8_POPAL